MSATITDAELKTRHAGMWASGDYPSMVETFLLPLGPRLVAACGIGPGMRVLDVAAGTGNAAVPAARRGASVVASDLTPELLEAGRAEHPEADIDWQVADAEALPWPDASYDVVMSTVGVMFAPHHQSAADELLRVTRPGGRLGILSWTPEGFIGRLFDTMRDFVPPPPAGVQPPPLWGTEDHVRGLFGGRVDDLTFTRDHIEVDLFTTPGSFRTYFRENYGPTLVAYRGLADQPDRIAALDAALDALVAEADEGAGRMRWEYVVVSGRRS